MDEEYSSPTCSLVRNGAGASSTSFWWRRCSEQSRVEIDHHVAVGVGQALGLHVPRPVQVALDEALAPAECGHRFPYRRLEQVRDLVQRPGHLEPAAAAAERGLDRDGQAVLLGERDDFLRARHRVGRARRERGSRPPARCAGPGPCRPSASMASGGGPIQVSPAASDRPGEVGVLGQEPVAGVHAVGAGLGGDLDDLFDVEVGLGGGGPVQRVRLVGQPDVQPVDVLFGVDGDAGQTGIPAGPDDADRDLATIRDEDLPHGNLFSRSALADAGFVLIVGLAAS